MSDPIRRTPASEAPEAVFVGPRLAEIAEAIRRRGLPLRVSAFSSIGALRDAARERTVACAVIDLVGMDDYQRLLVPVIAASGAIDSIVVIGEADAAMSALPRVRHVLKPSVDPRQILFAVSDALSARRETAASPASAPAPDSEPEAETVIAVEDAAAITDNSSAPDESAVAEAAAPIPPLAETHAPARPAREQTKGPSILERIWRRFLPYANLIYKKLAIVVLTSLFLLFLNYGATILFFLTSSRWSLPIELSHGHEMVVRAEKDLGEMRVRQNQVQQSLDAAKSARSLAERNLRDARLRLDMVKNTIDLELTQQNKLLADIREHILRLKRIINDFRNANGDGSFARNLQRAYESRTITRKSLDAGTLSVLESLHRMALVENDLAVAQLDETKIDSRVEFLKSLRQQIDLPEIRTLLTAGSDYAYLARDVIADQNVIAESKEVIDSKTLEITHLQNSFDVVTSNIDSLLSTPIGRAITAPVTVAFVPYSNESDYEPGNRLYGCWLLIAFCSQVGVAGQTVVGEATAVHPLFGKPLRGNFVEAILDDNESAKKELFHAVRPPLFF